MTHVLPGGFSRKNKSSLVIPYSCAPDTYVVEETKNKTFSDSTYTRFNVHHYSLTFRANKAEDNSYLSHLRTY